MRNRKALVIGILSGELEAPGGGGPAFVSAEIGSVNGYTVVVTWNQTITEIPTVVIQVNGMTQTISSESMDGATTSHIIPVLWHGSGDTVTVDENAVTNNCEYEGALNLQADTLVGTPVTTWADQSNNGHDFTQTGDERPALQTVGGFPAVVFDGVDDCMVSNLTADTSLPFTVFSVCDNTGFLLTKIANEGCEDPGSTGWSVFYNGVFGIALYSDASNYAVQITDDPISGRSVVCFEFVSLTDLHIHVNGVLSDHYTGGLGGGGEEVTTITNSEPVRLGIDGANGICDPPRLQKVNAVMLYNGIFSAANRAALETRLGARYGLTVP